MKFRIGCVSNSSSSSFIVIGEGELQIPEVFSDTLHIPNTFEGQEEFGWEVRDIFGIGSRINFCFLQIEYDERGNYPDKKNWKEMLEEVLTETLGVDIIENGLNGYIDHQSSASESENIEMFESKEKLKQFIFGDGSYIHTDNDNY